MRGHETLEFWGLWERLHNPDFKPVEQTQGTQILSSKVPYQQIRFFILLKYMLSQILYTLSLLQVQKRQYS